MEQTFILRTLQRSQLIGVRCLLDSLTLRFLSSCSLFALIGVLLLSYLAGAGVCNGG